MKIYVVTAGSHEDYRIIHATTDLKVAEAIKQKFSGGWDEPEIEVFENAENMLIPAWDVRFKKDGSVDTVTNQSGSEYAYGRINEVRKERDGVTVTVQADTAWDAVTIATNKRDEYLAKRRKEV